MSNELSQNPKAQANLVNAMELLGCAELDSSVIQAASANLVEFENHAHQAGFRPQASGAELICQILELAESLLSEQSVDSELFDELIGFAFDKLSLLQASLTSNEFDDEIEAFEEFARSQWGDYLTALDPDQLGSSNWQSATDAEPCQDEEPDIADDQIALLLSALPGTNSSASTEPSGIQDKPARTFEAEFDLPSTNTADNASDDKAKTALLADREMLEAYLDDANRCLESMEKSALELERDPDDKNPVDQICRELHTLKGASATVGLAELAGELHEQESNLQSVFDGTKEVDAATLLEFVDGIRDELSMLQNPVPTDAAEVTASDEETKQPQKTTVKSNSEYPSFANDESSIRIRASKLDRLMDMLAELVVLRNRRESHVVEFNSFNDELSQCVTRLSLAEEQYESDNHATAATRNQNTSCVLSEVGKDIEAVAIGMKSLQKPFLQDNHSISGFIRDFRQELMQLRRVPVSGLFQKLQRAARDAANSENKQVQIEIIGEQSGLEQEIQERLYESLLHVVRNSVSHGMESKDVRIKAGKSDVGTLTLEASSSAQLLIIEVRDDGAGLDHDAIRRRAIEKGLLSPHQIPSEAEIGKLIFVPGFSTKQEASAVSGRGIGMDIVSQTVDQLRGRIEVESVKDKGTTIRLLIPLKTGIEHVMVFRAGDQLFALPMQAVTAAKSANARIGDTARLSLSATFSNRQSASKNSNDVLLLRNKRSKADSSSQTDTNSIPKQVALEVDELIGPEEVVVRSLPVLLKNHPLFAGVTLSGSGEKVLLLNCDQVLEFCEFRNQQNVDEDLNAFESRNFDQKTALVVDDSLTARKALVKLLKQQGFAAVEAGDGLEALQHLHKQTFDLVLTDLDMPRFGGLELLSDIQRGQFCESPVVVVSSRNEELFRSKAMDVGAADYVTKPVSESSVIQLLQNLNLLNETVEG